MDNLLLLHQDLKTKTYRHGGYHAFNISDPKPRNIHKASVRDRLLHHAVYRVLYPYFDIKFIHDSYSCRLNKGTHKAMERFKYFGSIVSKNNTKQCWILKCDIKKFFASVDHNTLVQILDEHIEDKNVLWLLGQVIVSFSSLPSTPHIYAMADICNQGLPLGNLTSQLLVNIYMNKFDQYIKHKLKVKYYIRYADDFVVFTSDRKYLTLLLPMIQEFLYKKLKLILHPNKIFIKTFSSGVDFLGWVHFPDHRVLRTATKRRMLKKLAKSSPQESKASYLGMLRWGNTHKIINKVFKLVATSRKL